MRIESVTFENLNSLKGRWTVALNHPAYAATGIFAITGPTGAGKTTVLDAVSLALYGRTPRLSTLSKSENEIMTRGTGYAAAEVTFQTNGRRYRAQWEQRRARLKPDGQLQPAQVSLFEFQPETATWLSVADKVKTFTTKIQAVTGMTFEQFTRTMLLAQGNFAAFLKAETDDRAAMLERITGTEIYSRISEAAYERFAAEKEKLGQLETQLAASGTLSAEDRDATAARQKAKTEEAAALSAVGAFPTSAFVHADNAMQSTKVTKTSFFISIHSFGGHTAPFCPNYTRLTLPCLDFCKSFAVNLHFACNACISPKSGPLGQQKRRPNRIRKRSSAAEILYSNYRLQLLTELHFFTVRTFHGEKLHAVRPKRQPVNLVVEHRKPRFLRRCERRFNVRRVERNVVDGAGLPHRRVVLIRLND